MVTMLTATSGRTVEVPLPSDSRGRGVLDSDRSDGAAAARVRSLDFAAEFARREVLTHAYESDKLTAWLRDFR